MRRKAPRAPLKAFLFDLDGVLWFSVDAHRLAFQKAFHEMGIPWTFPRHGFAPYSGMTTERALERVLEDRGVRWTARRRAEFGRIKRRWALRFLRRSASLQLRLYPTLQKLQLTYDLALVSSAHPETVKIFLQRSRTGRFFKAVLSSGNVPYSKPDPRIYKEAVRRLGIRPKEGVAVEDTVSGTQAAIGAGLHVIGMRGTCAPRLLIQSGAFKTIGKITDLLSYASRS